MLGTAVSATGIVLTGIGTVVRVAPDLDRTYRRRFYQYAPLIRKLYDQRTEVKESGKGYQFTVDNRRVCKEFIDYIDAHDIREPPEQIPVSVKNVAADLEVELPNGDIERYPQGTISQRILVELLTLTIERTCRNYGLLIAVVGAILTLLGTLI